MAICVNNKVVDNYKKGMNINDAIRAEFEGQIADAVKADERLKELTPFNMVLRDAGISKYSTVGDLMNSGMYTASGMDGNEFLFPIFIEQTVREAIYGDDILSYLCNTTQGIDGNMVKAATLDLLSKENKKNVTMKRIAEGADLPLAKITLGEVAVNLWKHGRAIEMTYETTRRMSIDLFKKHMAAIVSDIAHQNLDSAVDVLANGDGNKNGATKIGTAGNIGAVTPEFLVGALIDYYSENHYAADTMTVNKDVFKKLVGFTFDPKMAAGASMNLTFDVPQLKKQNITLLCSEVPQIGSHPAILLSNRDMSLIRYEENGSNIQENQQFARNQTKLMTVSENSGYAINTVGSNRYIEITAYK